MEQFKELQIKNGMLKQNLKIKYFIYQTAVFDMEIVWLLFVVYCLVSFAQGNCCLKVLEEMCVECPSGMHLFRDNCIFDVKNCESYKDGFECSKCKEGFTLQNSKCLQTPPNSQKGTQSPSTPANFSVPQYKVVSIDFKNLHMIKDIDILDEFSISDEIFRGNYAKNVKNADILKAEQRKYPNGTIHIAIDYQNNKTQIYNATIMVNISTFIFKVISFELLEADTASGKLNQTEKQINSTVVPIKQQVVAPQLPQTLSFSGSNASFEFPVGKFSENEIDLVNYNQLEMMNVLDQEGMKYLNEETQRQAQKKIIKKPKNNSIFSTVIEVTEMLKAYVRIYDNGNVKMEYIIIEYMTNDKELSFIIVGEMNEANIKDSKTAIRLVYAGFDKEKLTENKQIKMINQNTSNQNTANQTEKVPQQNPSKQQSQSPQASEQSKTLQNEAMIKKMEFIEMKYEMELLKDIYFMIGKDEVKKKLKEYEDLDPDKVYIASLSHSGPKSANHQVEKLKTFNFYKLAYFSNGSNVEVVVSCNLQNFTPKVQTISKSEDKNEKKSVISPVNSTNPANTPISSTPNPSAFKPASEPTSDLPKKTIVIPSDFVLCNSSITQNVFYIIAMDTLTNKDRKYFNQKPLQIYLKNQTKATKIDFLFTFELNLKNQSKQIWIATTEVFIGTFRAQIIKNELFETIKIPSSPNQQSEQNESLKKKELITKNPTLPFPTVQGKTILLRTNRQRI